MSTPSIDTDGDRRHRHYFILILVIVLLLVFLHMMASIAVGVIAGILLWVMTRGIYEWLLKRTHERRALAAGLSVVATLLLVIVPLAVIVMVMTADAMRLAGDLQGWIPSVQTKLDAWMRLLHRNGLSIFGYELSPEVISTKIGEFSTAVGQFLLWLTQRTASNLASAVIMLFVALYTLYYFYVDNKRFLMWLTDIIPLETKHSRQLIDSFFSASMATLKTIGVLGVVQGIAAGIAYVIIGVPAPIFLTVLTIFATVIPSVGGALVAVPVSVGLFIAGQTGWAIALLVWYLVVVGNLDNFLRPYLMHREIRLHQLVIFVVTLGGIARYGFFGVFIGPVIAALLSASLDIYREMYPRPVDAASVPDQTSPV